MQRSMFLARWLGSLVAVLCVTTSAQTASAQGVQRASGDAYDKLPVRAVDLGSIELPGKVDLRSYLPTPGDQGKTNSCVAWAIGYAAYSCQICQQRHRSPQYEADVFSPDFIYSQLSNNGDGLEVMQVLRFVKANGCASQAAMTRNTDSQQVAATEAATFRALEYGRVTDLTDMKTWIHQGYPVILLIELDEEFKSKQPGKGLYRWSGDPTENYHVVCAVGYDDKKHALLIMNSWGQDWKNDGFCWASYENFTAINDQNWCAEAYVVHVKQPAPQADSISVGKQRRGSRMVDQWRDFSLQADGKIYQDQKLISPSAWEFDDIACSRDTLFALANDQKIYKMNYQPTISWTHLSTDALRQKKIAMIAANKSHPLHVLTNQGELFRYDSTGQWQLVKLSDQGTTAVDLRIVGTQLRATTNSGRVFTLDDNQWALAP
jgi:hypothetical protein